LEELVRGAPIERRDAPSTPRLEVSFEEGEAIEELPGGGLLVTLADGRRVPVRAARSGVGVEVWCAGEAFSFGRAAGGARRGPGGSSEMGLRAPMPGRVLVTAVEEGAHVRKGQTILVLEAMKMEHEIKAPADGVVAKLPFRDGDRVEAGAVLVELEG
jgi:biotin carboxyl carrier protein